MKTARDVAREHWSPEEREARSSARARRLEREEQKPRFHDRPVILSAETVALALRAGLLRPVGLTYELTHAGRILLGRLT